MEQVAWIPLGGHLCFPAPPCPSPAILPKPFDLSLTHRALSRPKEWMGLEGPAPCLPGHQEGFPAQNCHRSGVVGAPALPAPCPSSQLQAGSMVSLGRWEHAGCSLYHPRGVPGASVPLAVGDQGLWNEDCSGVSEPLDRPLPSGCSHPPDLLAQPALVPLMVSFPTPPPPFGDGSGKEPLCKALCSDSFCYCFQDQLSSLSVAVGVFRDFCVWCVRVGADLLLSGFHHPFSSSFSVASCVTLLSLGPLVSVSL